MSQPEISRRCSSCGASARNTEALFCAECGKPLATDAAQSSAAPAEPTMTEQSKPIPLENAERANIAPNQTPAPDTKEEPAAQPRANRAPADIHPHSIAGRTRETLHRASVVASAAARGVMEEPAKRVEQIRHVSSHMIEEASYDPSLRFVLVALCLFVVFIVLLVLSKVMG